MLETSKKNLLVFGYGLVLILCLVASRSFFKHGFQFSTFMLLFVVIIILMLTIFKLEWLAYVYSGWMFVAQRVGDFISALILIFVYYVLFSLIGVICRIFKKDFLDSKRNIKKKSYWNAREQIPFNKERYTRQF